MRTLRTWFPAASHRLRLTNEVLDDILAPGLEDTSAEPAGKPLHAGEANPVDLGGIAVENANPGVLAALHHDLIAMIAMIAMIVDRHTPAQIYLNVSRKECPG